MKLKGGKVSSLLNLISVTFTLKSSFSKAIADFAYRCKWKCSSAPSYETYDKGRVGETAECGEESVRPRDWSHKVKSTNSSFRSYYSWS